MQHLTGIAESRQLTQPAVAFKSKSTQTQSDSLCLCHVQLPNLLRDAKFRQVLADNLKQQGNSVSSIADEEILRVRTLPRQGSSCQIACPFNVRGTCRVNAL